MNNDKCCNPGPPAKESPSGGYEEKFFGLDVYFNWPAGATQAVVLATDVFGWKRPLLRRFADKIAGAGFVAVVPDYLQGDPIDTPKYDEDRSAWFANHPFELGIGDTLAVVRGVKERGIKSVGVVGFCYGGKVAGVIAKEDIVDAVVLLHPVKISLDDINQMKRPIAILSAELDKHTTVSEVEAWKKILELKTEVEVFAKIYPGVDHGWSVRYDENDEKAIQAAYEAQSDTISWFKKHLK